MGLTSATELVASVEADVAAGTLGPGDRLPSVRDRASELGLATTTVAAAYRRLRERGVVVGRGRQGTIIAPAVRSTSRPIETLPEGLVDAVTGNPDPQFLPDLAAAVAQGGPTEPVRYGDALVHPALEEVGRRLLDGEGVPPGRMSVVSGAMDAIARVLDAQGLRIGDRLGVEDPGHVPVHRLARSRGLELVPLPVDEYGLVPDSLRRSVRRGLRAVVLTPRAQNPTGAAVNAERAAALAEVLAESPDVVLIQDDHAGPVAGVDLELVPVSGVRRWATIRSLSKSLGPDLRLALVVGDDETVDALERDLVDGPGWVSHLLQRTAATLLTDRGVTSRVDEAGREYTRRRGLLVDALSDAGVAASGRSGLNVWIPVVDEQSVVAAAAEAGIAIRAAGPFRIVSPPAVRITVTGLGDDELVRTAAAIGAAVGRRGRSVTV